MNINQISALLIYFKTSINHVILNLFLSNLRTKFRLFFHILPCYIRFYLNIMVLYVILTLYWFSYVYLLPTILLLYFAVIQVTIDLDVILELRIILLWIIWNFFDNGSIFISVVFPLTSLASLDFRIAQWPIILVGEGFKHFIVL